MYCAVHRVSIKGHRYVYLQERWFDTYRCVPDELEDTLEYKGSIVLGDRDAVDTEGTVCPQNIGVQFEFLLLKAIQELKTEISVLK